MPRPLIAAAAIRGKLNGLKATAFRRVLRPAFELADRQIGALRACSRLSAVRRSRTRTRKSSSMVRA